MSPKSSGFIVILQYFERNGVFFTLQKHNHCDNKFCKHHLIIWGFDRPIKAIGSMLCCRSGSPGCFTPTHSTHASTTGELLSMCWFSSHSYRTLSCWFQGSYSKTSCVDFWRLVSHNCFYYTSKPEYAIPDDKKANLNAISFIIELLQLLNSPDLE